MKINYQPYGLILKGGEAFNYSNLIKGSDKQYLRKQLIKLEATE